ncbi:MAG TPA: FAD-dependent oxidoreductase [Methylobacter sp.]|jgi:flavin-dependent dehydrogenase
MQPILEKRENIVIGGGVAGAAAAIWLAKQGRDVVLLEKEAAPRHKVCGEFISIEAQHYLKELGIDLMALGAMPIGQFLLIKGSRKINTRLPFLALSLSRYVLDEALLQLAISTGVELRRGINVASLVPNNPGWIISSPTSELQGERVFLATGKHNLRGWPRDNAGSESHIGLKMHYILTPAQQQELAGYIEVMLFHGGYAGLEPIENGKANLCLVIRKTVFFRYGKDWEQLLRVLSVEIPHLKARLQGASPCWERPLAIAGIPYGYIHPAEGKDRFGLFPIGDQMAVIPSFCGDGIAIALHTAFLATSTNTFNYIITARHELQLQMLRASQVARIMAHSLTCELAFLFCRIRPSLLVTLITKTRVSYS